MRKTKMNCTICLQMVNVEETWQTFFNKERNNVCGECRRKSKRIYPPHCKVCGRKSAETMCFDCVRWKQMYDGNDQLDRNLSLFTYNEFMQELIYTWKYRGDYYIVEAFREQIQQAYVQLVEEEDMGNEGNIVIAPVPLSEDRRRERGFNQAEQLANMLNKEITYLFRRVHSEKQAKKNRMERMTMTNPFTLIKNVTKQVILIDDLYTTGRTLRHAASLCKLNGCEKVYSLTLCRG